MPFDFTLYGGKNCLNKIGQNVPVETARFIVEQAIKTLEIWNEPREMIKILLIKIIQNKK